MAYGTFKTLEEIGEKFQNSNISPFDSFVFPK